MRSRISYLIGWIIILCAIGWVVASEQRFQRFTELQDTQMVADRVAGSVNTTFFALAAEYPLGNGMGGGGTSIPFFLQDRIENPVIMENEYARVTFEQGLPGLFLWLAFVLWVVTRRTGHRADQWFIGRRLAWATCFAYFAAGLVGTGLFTAIPQTCLFMLCVGWVGARQDEKPILEVPPVLGRYQTEQTG